MCQATILCADVQVAVAARQQTGFYYINILEFERHSVTCNKTCIFRANPARRLDAIN
jgi:hypothetical protein